MPRTIYKQSGLVKRARTRSAGPPRKRGTGYMPFARSVRGRRISNPFQSSLTPGTMRRIRYTSGIQTPLYTRPTLGSNVETHYHDVGNGSTAVNAVINAHVNGVAAGPGLSQRTGYRIQMMNLNFRYTIKANVPGWVAGEPLIQRCRIFVVYDKSPHGGYPNITTVLQNNTYDSFQAMDSRDRIQFLYDRFITVNLEIDPGTNKAMSTSETSGDIQIPLNRPATWAGGESSGELASMLSGGLYSYCFPEAGAAPLLDFRTRLTFSP